MASTVVQPGLRDALEGKRQAGLACEVFMVVTAKALQKLGWVLLGWRRRLRPVQGLVLVWLVTLCLGVHVEDVFTEKMHRLWSVSPSLLVGPTAMQQGLCWGSWGTPLGHSREEKEWVWGECLIEPSGH